MLTGKQLKTIRQVAGFTETDLADAMFVMKRSISSIETGETTASSNIRYYEMSLKMMIDHMDDAELKSICYDLVDYYYKSNSDVDESVPVIDGVGESVDGAWYVFIEYDEEPMDFVYKSFERKKAIDYARDLKRRHPYQSIKVYHDFDW